jgi:hypothetical protein
MEGKAMNHKLRAVIVSAAVTLLLWGIALVVLNAIYHGSFPMLLTTLAAFVSPLAGGFIVSRLEQVGGARLGALGGGVAGLVALLALAAASRFAPTTTLSGIVLVFVGAVGGGLGSLLNRTRRQRER